MSDTLPLENFREILGYHPWHFWGLADSDAARVTSACNDVVSQYAWQNADAAGRADILEAIEAATARLAEQMGFWPAPHYAQATRDFPQHHDISVWRMNHAGPDGRWLDVRLPEGYLQSLGVETRDLISAVAPVYSDADGDGLNETFTLTVATAVTDPDQIAVYFNSADRLDGEDVSERWRIAPVKVSISGGTATIRGRAWQVVRPILYEGASVSELDPGEAANFAASLDVYRRYTDPDGNTTDDGQATLVWETLPFPSWACCDPAPSAGDYSTDPASVAYAIARAGIRSARTGIANIGRAVYNATSDVWSSVNWGLCRPPDRAIVRYRAGYPLEDGNMARKMRTAVARLAAAEMPRQICACDTANRELYRWQFDLARAAGAMDEQYRISDADLDNPFGTRRGQVYAWRFARDFRIMTGLSM